MMTDLKSSILVECGASEMKAKLVLVKNVKTPYLVPLCEVFFVQRFGPFSIKVNVINRTWKWRQILMALSVEARLHQEKVSRTAAILPYFLCWVTSWSAWFRCVLGGESGCHYRWQADRWCLWQFFPGTFCLGISNMFAYLQFFGWGYKYIPGVKWSSCSSYSNKLRCC